jgi:hypothetical protein
MRIHHLFSARTIEYRRLCVPERDGAGERSRTGPNGVTIIAAFHDPLAIFLTDNFADMMTPDNNSPDRWTACIRSIVSP